MNTNSSSTQAVNSRSFAIVSNKGEVVWAMELEHRGHYISEKLSKRSGQRRLRRQLRTRYRPCRFDNRKREEGWLPPSIQHRVDTTMTWVMRICRWVPIANIEVERVKFDLQKLQNPEINSVEYQQGELMGWEVRQYLLEKYSRTCVYCGAKNVPFELDHIHPRSKGGSDRVSNLVLSCHNCNQTKGNKDIIEFLNDKPDLVETVLCQAKTPLKDKVGDAGTRSGIQADRAAAVNSTRNAIYGAIAPRYAINKLREIKPTTGYSGGRTKYNRSRLGLPKAHWIDASCVGEVDKLVFLTKQPLIVKATGHGTRHFHIPNDIGLIDKSKKAMPTIKEKIVHGFRTGDMAKAIVTKGNKIGTYVGRVAVRRSGSFNIQTASGTVQGISYKYFQPIHRQDGYSYGFDANANTDNSDG